MYVYIEETIIIYTTRRFFLIVQIYEQALFCVGSLFRFTKISLYTYIARVVVYGTLNKKEKRLEYTKYSSHSVMKCGK